MTENDRIAIRASEYIKNTSINNKHLDIITFDIVLPDEFFAEPRLEKVVSIDLHCLGLNDNDAIALAASHYVHNLHWINLAGNVDIGATGVHAISKGVYEGRLPKLQWLDLLATSCNATPYVDGSYWRMSRAARELRNKYGPQAWMMLGSRIVENENEEILSTEARDVPPSRYSYDSFSISVKYQYFNKR